MTDHPMSPDPESGACASERRHWRYYVPGWFVRRKLRVTRSCDWKLVGEEWVERRGLRYRYKCSRCDRECVVLTPKDGKPFEYACKTPRLWLLRRRVTPNALWADA